MMKRRTVGLVLLLVASFACSAHAERRVALVVGNSGYRNVTPLENPAKDASLMAETLKGLGFSLIGNGAQLDLDKSALDEAVQSFGRQIQGADVAMFYYAGHGVQVRGSNYLVPVNANPTREADVDFQMVDINLVMNQMQGSGTRLNLVILDACRNNPFGGRGLRSSEGGLAQMRAPEGTLISYATQPGNVAQDGDDGHSPYTKALAGTLKRAGLDLFDTFNEVGLAVKRATGGSQQPWVSSSPIDGKFYFTSPPTSISTAPSETPPASTGSGAVATPQPGDSRSLERDVWNAIKDTSKSEVLDKFLNDFPNGVFAGAARERMAALTTRIQPGGSRQESSANDCDSLAASPTDPKRPPGIIGVQSGVIHAAEAIGACQRAVSQFPAVARYAYQLGRAFEAGKQHDDAIRLFSQAVGAGYAAAMADLGNMYVQGNGVAKDYPQALRLYHQAIEAGNVPAISDLGYMYTHGNGVPQDYTEAVRLYRQAADLGSPGGLNRLGFMYQNGMGVPKNVTEALGLYRRAAEAGSPGGMANLGTMYENGLGVAKDLREAARWYRKAADAGSPSGMKDLGTLYDKGLGGLPHDRAQALSWFQKAADLGNEDARKALNR
jgi:TPR repeat protein